MTPSTSTPRKKTTTADRQRAWQETRPDIHGFEDRIARIIAALGKRALGVEPKKNTVARQALAIGLDAMERELGLVAK